MDEKVIVRSDIKNTDAASSPNTLWNEGRVVGYSAYEVYVRQHMLEDPNTPPASEREWLASSLASGASILINVPQVRNKGSGENWIYEVTLPDNSRLCAASTIVASLFYGEGEGSGNGFASYVESYGDLVDRAAMLSSTSDDFPPAFAELNDNNWMRKVRSYLHILDGVVLQTGEWFQNTGIQNDNKADFKPDLTSNAGSMIRLHIRGPIDDSFWIVLSGFTMRNIVSGTSKVAVTGLDPEIYGKTFTSALNSDHPENGDFLGPETYPWANKIVFTVPSQAATSPLLKSTINGKQVQLSDTPVIDLEHCDPSTYYDREHSESTVDSMINELVTVQDGVAILATHQRSRAFAPSLYASLYGQYKVDEPASSALYPIDTVAPRTIKFFHGEEALAKQFEQDIPYNFALVRRNDDYVLEQIQWVGNEAKIVPVADSDVVKGEKSKGQENQYHMRPLHGTNSKLRAIALTKDDGTLLGQKGEAGTEEHDTLNWKILLDALGLDKQIDVLGQGLREFKKLIVDIFEGTDIRDVDAQYVVKVKKDGPNYSIYFDEIDIEVPNSVTFATSHQDNNHYVLTATTQDAQGTAYKSVALTDAEGNDLLLDGSSATIDATDDKLTWQRLLNALGENKHISMVGPELLQFKSALSGISAGNKYVLVLDDEGDPTFQTLEDVNIPEFPSYILASVSCNPTLANNKKMCDTITLDVFGYTQEHKNSSGKTTSKSLNTFSTLTHTKATTDAWSKSYARHGLVQPFTVATNSLASWASICDAMRNAGSLVDGDHAKVIFTTGGRPIYRSYVSTSQFYRNHICAPRSNISIVAYIQPIKKSGSDYVKTYTKGGQNEGGETTVGLNNPVRGMLIWCDYHGSSGWQSAPSGGSYTGSLVGDPENQDWVIGYNDFDV